MNKKTIIFLVILGIIIIGGLFYFYKNKVNKINSNNIGDNEKSNPELISEKNEDSNFENEVVLNNKIQLKINFTKDAFIVGETPDNAYYFVDYKDTNPLEVLVLFGKTKEGLVKKAYGKYRGNLDLIFKSFISEKYDCDGNYIYYLSVYDCNSVDKLLTTENCRGIRDEKDLKNIDQNLEALYYIQKEITVNCPLENPSCCSNMAYSCIYDKDCLTGYYCQDGDCLKN
jgi:uncharacterized protein YxeA